MDHVEKFVQLCYLGNSCISISTPDGTRIVSDPYGEERPDGLTDLPIDLKADAVTVSHIHPDHNNANAVLGNPVVLTEPGDYVIKSIRVTACPGWEGSPEGPNHNMRNVIFVFETMGEKVVQLGDSGVVDDLKVIQVISNADLVVVNIDGYVMPHAEILPFMKRIQARTVLLAHYTLPGHEVWCDAPTPDEFIQSHASGWSVLRSGGKLEISHKMPQQIAVMTPLTLR